jgi:hypothetical protein
MTQQEQGEALLRLIKNRTDARRRKALLESELSAAGRALYEIGDNLRRAGALDYTLKQIDNAPPICELGKLKAMLTELGEVAETLATLNRAVEAQID